MKHSEQINELATALSKAQAQFPQVKKECSNPFFKSKYADLAAIVEAVRKSLSEHGLAYTQLPAIEQDFVAITTMLMHSSGQWISEELKMPLVKFDAQGVGSALTYGRRYALQSVLGIAAEVDDDGNAAVGNGKQESHHEPPAAKAAEKCAEVGSRPANGAVSGPVISDAQRKRLYAISKAKDWSPDMVQAVLGRFGFAKSDEITRDKYEAICDTLERGAAEVF